MKQKPEIETLIEQIHTVLWSIDAHLVEKLISQHTTSEEVDSLKETSEHLRNAVKSLLYPAIQEREVVRKFKPTPLDTLKDVFGL
jgi:hypothetical protein